MCFNLFSYHALMFAGLYSQRTLARTEGATVSDHYNTLLLIMFAFYSDWLTKHLEGKTI